MKTKYIIVNTEDRLPTEFGQFYTDQGLIDFVPKNGNFWDENDEFELYPNWWLEEVEDLENEMNEVLEFLIHLKNHKEENGETDYYLEYEKTAWFNAECLLTKLKQ